MKRLLTLACVGALALTGCGSSHAPKDACEGGVPQDKAQFSKCFDQMWDAEQQQSREQRERDAELAAKYRSGQ